MLSLSPPGRFIAINNESETGGNLAAGVGTGDGWNVMDIAVWLSLDNSTDCWLDWAAFHVFCESPNNLDPQYCEDGRLWTQPNFRQNGDAMMEIYACDSSWIEVVVSAEVQVAFPPHWKAER